MKIKSIRRILDREKDLDFWWDEELDRDGLDLDQWGFLQGYYEEIEAS
ncbi:hypothetical protein J4216_01360 [Candidatus Woesearchaeota archaeon]|nr:hypothetical protein [Candidatus Woesearchaeota archaeon]